MCSQRRFTKKKHWFSSVFEAHASKTYEQPIKTMISMHLVRGPAKREAPLFPI